MAFSIMEIQSRLFLTEDAGGNLCFGSEDERLIFYDETDAENVLLMLNEEYEGCYTLLNEAISESLEGQGMDCSPHL